MRRMKKCVKTQSDSNSLSFRELEFLTRFWLAIFFTLNHSVIAGEKAMLLQGAVDIFVQVIKRSCKGKGNGSGLAGDSAATYRYFYIILAVLFRNSKGEKGDVVLRFEIGRASCRERVERAVV